LRVIHPREQPTTCRSYNLLLLIIFISHVRFFFTATSLTRSYRIFVFLKSDGTSRIISNVFKCPITPHHFTRVSIFTMVSSSGSVKICILDVTWLTGSKPKVLRNLMILFRFDSIISRTSKEKSP